MGTRHFVALVIKVVPGCCEFCRILFWSSKGGLAYAQTSPIFFARRHLHVG